MAEASDPARRAEQTSEELIRYLTLDRIDASIGPLDEGSDILKPRLAHLIGTRLALLYLYSVNSRREDCCIHSTLATKGTSSRMKCDGYSDIIILVQLPVDSILIPLWLSYL